MANWSELAKQSQEVINSAVAAVTTTKYTQTKLEQQMDYTDEAVGTHNYDGEAHPDIREQLSRLFDPPTISGPNTVEYGEEATFEFSAVARVNFVKLEKFYVDFMDGSPRETIIANEEGPTLWKHTFYGERNSNIWFTVMAYGSSFLSDKTKQDLLLTHHIAPDMSEMTTTLPEIVNHSQTYTFMYANVTDEDGDLATVDLSCASESLIFTETKNLQPNQEYSFKVKENVVDAEDIIVTFTATDERGLKTTRAYSVHVNAVPVVGSITHTLPNRLTAGTTVMARFSGITDEDGDPEDITYDITSSIPEITFGKTSGIHQNEDISVITSSDAVPGTPYTLSLTIHDADGAVTSYSLESAINILPRLDGLVTNQHDYMYPGETQSYTFSGGVDADDNEVTYGFETDYPGIISFNKTTGVAANTPVAFTLGSGAVRGQAYTYRVTGTDKSGAVAKVTRTIRTNRKVTASQIVMTPDKFKHNTEPGQEYILTFTPDTDVDGHVITYNLTSDDGKVTFSQQDANHISFTSPTEDSVPRGSSYTATLTADDGYEVVTKAITIQQNRVPVTDDFQLVTVKYLTAGATNRATVIGVNDPDKTKVFFKATPSIQSISIADGEVDKTFDIVVAPDALPGQTFTIDFAFTDEDGGTAAAQYSGQINAAPVIDAMKLNGLPEYLIPGNRYTLTVTGAVDPNTEGITYAIQNPTLGLTFSKYESIGDGEEFTLVVDNSIERGATASFVVAAVDPSLATTGRTYTAKVNRIMTGDDTLVWLPRFRHPDTTTWAESAYMNDADGHALTYTVTSDNPVVQFVTKDSSTGEVVESEPMAKLSSFTPTATSKFGIKISPDAPRGTPVKITASVTDGLETWHGEVNLNIKTLPTEFKVTSDGFETLKGGAEFAVPIIATWVDSDTSLGYDGTLTTWSGFSANGFRMGTVSSSYISGATSDLQAPKVAEVTPATITVSLAISDGISVVNNNYTFEVTVNPIWVTKQPAITYPVEGQEVPYEGYTFTWDAAECVADMDESMKYPSDGSEK